MRAWHSLSGRGTAQASHEQLEPNPLSSARDGMMMAWNETDGRSGRVFRQMDRDQRGRLFLLYPWFFFSFRRPVNICPLCWFVPTNLPPWWISGNPWQRHPHGSSSQAGEMMIYLSIDDVATVSGPSHARDDADHMPELLAHPSMTIDRFTRTRQRRHTKRTRNGFALRAHGHGRGFAAWRNGTERSGAAWRPGVGGRHAQRGRGRRGGHGRRGQRTGVRYFTVASQPRAV